MTQHEALAILKTGANIFLTGEPGSGKTHAINQYVAYLREHDIEPAITASTGIAATHIGGMTIHSWSGIGVASALTPQDIITIAGRNKIRKRIISTRILIIDEVSMLPAAALSLVDAVCRAVREINEPFGGLQVILVGDFFQLPPVSRNGAKIPFAFESSAWSELAPIVCYLTEQYRQNDTVFLSALSAIRAKNPDTTLREPIVGRMRTILEIPEDIPKLFSHNADVDRINTDKLGKIAGDAIVFYMQSFGRRPLIEFLKKSCLSPEALELKKGAAVMFTKNSPQEKFVNGSLGTVQDFDEDTGFPIVALKEGGELIAEPMEWAVEEGGKMRAKIVQVPLRLAWAMTVHKSQGMSMDAAVMDLSDAFEYGQGYVAFSRVRRLSGLYLLGANERAFEVHPGIFEKDKEFRAVSKRNSKYLSLLTPTEIQARHKKFIHTCGGEEKEGAPRHATASGGKKEYKMDASKEETRTLIRQGYSVEEVAKKRGKSVGTILKHLEILSALKKLYPEDVRHILRANEKTIAETHAAFRTLGAERLKPIFERLEGRIPYDTIRLARVLFKLE
ncbi:MAG: AAA family ATPase [Candidatus Sungbacteria bacterium]|nr:AAA family ATPase [Candidatus Sungbacteria bacterium]